MLVGYIIINEMFSVNSHVNKLLLRTKVPCTIKLTLGICRNSKLPDLE